MTELFSATAIAAGQAVFKKSVSDLYEYISEKTGKKILQWNTEKKIETLYKKISKVRQVKTIWQVDKPVDLSEFYCDPHIKIDKERKIVRKIADIGLKGNILIEGIAGQGKSIFLRYLSSRELLYGEGIPLFIELRRVDKDHSLKDRIVAAFDALGLDVDDELFKVLANSGKIVLMLDAYDEIPGELKSSVLTDIEDIVSKHENIRVITTSRPQENIRTSNYFSNVVLDNLKKKEYQEVIKKLAKDQDWANSLIGHIEHRSPHIKSLLFSPLMVTLLVLLYKSYQHLPANLSGFYDVLFQMLLQRHDGTKPGFTRQRKCDLDDIQYRNAFEALCLLAKKSPQQSFSISVLHGVAEEAIAQTNLKAKPADFINDIVRITCLILREGDEHRFIHKTVQEYYAASFIQKKPDTWAKQLYTRISDSDNRYKWQQELEFLSEIDSYRYNRYFLLPICLDVLSLSEKQLQEKRLPATIQQAKFILNGVYIYFGSRNIVGYYYGSPIISFEDEVASLIDKIVQLYDKNPVTVDSFIEIQKINPTKGNPPEVRGILEEKIPIPASLFLDHPEYSLSTLSVIDKFFANIFHIAQDISLSLEKTESSSLLDGLV